MNTARLRTKSVEGHSERQCHFKLCKSCDVASIASIAFIASSCENGAIFTFLGNITWCCAATANQCWDSPNVIDVCCHDLPSGHWIRQLLLFVNTTEHLQQDLMTESGQSPSHTHAQANISRLCTSCEWHDWGDDPKYDPIWWSNWLLAFLVTNITFITFCLNAASQLNLLGNISKDNSWMKLESQRPKFELTTIAFTCEDQLVGPVENNAL